MKKNANQQTIKDDLIRIKEGLEKEKKIGVDFAQRLSEVIARVLNASRGEDASRGVKTRLKKIKTLFWTKIKHNY